MGKSESVSRDWVSGDVVMDVFLEVLLLLKMCVVCVLCVMVMCEDALRELYAFEYVEMTSCDAYLIFVELDVFMFEYLECYSEIVIEEWYVCMYYVVVVLYKF